MLECVLLDGIQEVICYLLGVLGRRVGTVGVGCISRTVFRVGWWVVSAIGHSHYSSMSVGFQRKRMYDEVYLVIS